MKKFFVILFVVIVLAAVFVVPVFAQGVNPPVVVPPITPAFLTVFVAGIISLLFNYFPYLAGWYDKFSEIAKQQIMGALMILTIVVIFIGKCYGLFETNLICSTQGAFDALYNLFLAIGVNQGVHTMTKPSTAFKQNSPLMIGFDAPKKKTGK